MGTNYYLSDAATEGQPPPALIHVGKSSYGWCFLLHVIPEEGLCSLEDWRARWSRPGAQLWANGAPVTPEELENTITNRSFVNRHGTGRNRAWYEKNDAERGPRSLARFKVGRGGCVAHGPGTWDLIEGEFS